MFSKTEHEAAIAVSDFTWQYIQNKVADYADQLVEFDIEKFSSLEKATLAREVLRGQLFVLEELLSELTIPREVGSPT